MRILSGGMMIVMVVVTAVCAGEPVDLTGTWQSEDKGVWLVTQIGSRIEVQPAPDNDPLEGKAPANLSLTWRNGCWLEGQLAGTVAEASGQYVSRVDQAGLVNASTLNLEYRLEILGPDKFEVKTLRTEGESVYKYPGGDGASKATTDFVKGTFKATTTAPNGTTTTKEEKTPPQPVKVFRRMKE